MPKLLTKEDSVAEPKEDDLVKSVESLLAEKQAIAAREKKLIEDLNAVLGKMGHRVVSTKSGVHTGAGTGNKPGRPGLDPQRTDRQISSAFANEAAGAGYSAIRAEDTE
jgi:hypothetical protein